MVIRRNWLWAAVGTAAVLAGVSAVDARGFRRYLALTRDAESLQEKNRALAAQNAAMRREADRLQKNPKALEQTAREELGLIKPGEIVLNVE